MGSNAYWQGDSVLNSKLQIKVSSDEVPGRTTLETAGALINRKCLLGSPHWQRGKYETLLVHSPSLQLSSLAKQPSKLLISVLLSLKPLSFWP